MATVSVASLVRTLGDLQLLQPAQLKELTRILRANAAEPRAAARELIQRGWLTAYQVRELFQGRGQELVLGRYVLLEPLGEGGMGQVFKARHRELNRMVAVKILREERLAKRDAVRRFYREIQAAAQLSHANIVLVYDANRVNNKLFFVMEYLEGIDLSKLVKQSGPLPVALACEYIRQAALGLQHAFERGLVHRDIKPANLLVTLPPRASAVAASQPAAEAPRGQVVKILDLGLACGEWSEASDSSNTHLTQEGMVLGTVDFIAPEQAKDAHHVDIRADLYSLGCTFYYLLTGRPPFPEGTAMEKLLKHQTEEPVAVRMLRPDLPPEVSALIDKLLLKRPEDRYQTPAELAEAVVSALAVVGVSSISRPLSEGAFEGFSLASPALVAGSDAELSLSATPVTPDTVLSAGSWADLVPTPPTVHSSWSGRRSKGGWKKERIWLAVILAFLFVAGLLFLLSLPPEPPKGPDKENRPTKLKKAPERRPRSLGGRANAPPKPAAPDAADKPGQPAVP